MNVLGIESSCDETAAAVVTSERQILSNIVYDQMDLHALYGGVVPEIAARAHAKRLKPVVEEALSNANMTLKDINLIAVTSGPGLVGGLLSGVSFARGLSAGSGCRLVGVNHLLGHALTPRLSNALEYPYLMLLISGGHCQFISIQSPTRCHRLGATLDDAPGEVFDKIAKYLNLSHYQSPQSSGGVQIQLQAQQGDPTSFAFPRPLSQRDDANMSFSGLKTAVRQAIDGLSERTPSAISDICASFQMAVADILAIKSHHAMQQFKAQFPHAQPVFAIAGGVAANTQIRASLTQTAQDNGFACVLSPVHLCTDNAAMIAWAGYEYAPFSKEQDLVARPRWPLDHAVTPLVGYGKKGAKA